MPTAQEEITASMEDFFGLPEGVSITYEDYMVADSYPEDGVEDDYLRWMHPWGRNCWYSDFI